MIPLVLRGKPTHPGELGRKLSGVGVLSASPGASYQFSRRGFSLWQHAWGADGLVREVGPCPSMARRAAAFWTISVWSPGHPRDLDSSLQEQMLPVRLNARMSNTHVLESLVRPRPWALSRSSLNLHISVSKEVVKFAALCFSPVSPDPSAGADLAGGPGATGNAWPAAGLLLISQKTLKRL